ncbi:MAG: SUMF1/EgtB/PvdO family nonheme iron enzyme [Candidatus Saganbacteria bacterium]|nr:SUMF1/EgtB/PvdO family nonheme iron enzyme [Candidatus Saganbacteria bacterium]
MIRHKLISFDAKEALERPDFKAKDLLKSLDVDDLRRFGLPIAKVLIPRKIERGIVQEFLERILEGKGKNLEEVPAYPPRRRSSGGSVFIPMEPIIRADRRTRAKEIRNTETKILTQREVEGIVTLEEKIPIRSLIILSGGRFRVGNNEAENEKPEHEITHGPFLVSPYPVTNAEYQNFIADRGYYTDRYWSEEGLAWKEGWQVNEPAFWSDTRYSQAFQPVVGISWYEAEAYLNWAGLRFLTEHEWELTAQGASMDVILSPTRPSAKTIEVNDDRLVPNELGLSHMNLYEWCSDWYSKSYYQTLASFGVFDDPKGPERGVNRVKRGMEITVRSSSPPGSFLPYVGLRAARDL